MGAKAFIVLVATLPGELEKGSFPCILGDAKDSMENFL
jgi:hypothetical protein